MGKTKAIRGKSAAEEAAKLADGIAMVFERRLAMARGKVADDRPVTEAAIALATRTAEKIEATAGWLRKERLRLQEEICCHPSFGHFANAEGYWYACNICNKPWLNEVPKLRRTFEFKGDFYRLDGRGGVKKLSRRPR